MYQELTCRKTECLPKVNGKHDPLTESQRCKEAVYDAANLGCEMSLLPYVVRATIKPLS